MNTPLVSIIIPTYNRAHLIGETLNSVMVQKYQNWECIIVDDGSNDHTDEIINEYLSKDNRFKYFHRSNAHLPGGNGARNYGFHLSKGTYINWFDSDDIMYPDFIDAKMQPFLAHSNTDVVFSAFENVDAKGKRTRIANQHFSGNILDDLVEGKVSFGPLSFMLRREKLNNISYNEHLKKNQDLDFFFRFFTSNPSIKIVHVNKILFTVRKHSGSMTYRTYKDISKMTSIYTVYLMVLNYFVKQNHLTGISKYKYRCLNSLKMMVTHGYYREVIERLFSFPYISISQKVYLLGCMLSQHLINRGANQFVKDVSENSTIRKSD
ncbi:glycosyltransferase family 2 protein [Winogradskyella forsetii]|uniref:glycosyltransferase family 2 protein n=1 Tax=Winogradskyella forsetii TaxID=2686077 RepID=UPI0015C0E593|nr:glycosyltransferase family 2 protein [Winogradskyella forsetii]